VGRDIGCLDDRHTISSYGGESVFTPTLLDRDVATLRDTDYHIVQADASGWFSVADAHRDLSRMLPTRGQPAVTQQTGRLAHGGELDDRRCHSVVTSRSEFAELTGDG
jgi:hypothetical protein